MGWGGRGQGYMLKGRINKGNCLAQVDRRPIKASVVEVMGSTGDPPS